MKNNSNFIEYSIFVDTLWFEKTIDLGFTDREIDTIILYQKSNQRRETYIKFNLSSGVKSYQDAFKLTEAPLRHILNNLAINICEYLEKPRVVSHSIDGESASYSNVISVKVPIKASESILRKIKDDIDNNEYNYVDHYYYEIFRNIMHIEDVMTRHVLLYSIMQSVTKKNQEKMDSVIIGMEPSVEIKNSTRDDKPRKETIYRYCRNEIGHGGKSVDIKELKDIINQNIKKFSELVKEVIIQNAK